MKNRIKKLSAADLICELKRNKITLVLAESCSGGSLLAELTDVPGASEVIAGGFVVYQPWTKREWLRLPPSLLKTHADGVHPKISQELCRLALRKVPASQRHSTMVVGVTGHLSPLQGRPYAHVSIRYQSLVFEHTWTATKMPSRSSNGRAELKKELSALVINTINHQIQFMRSNHL